MSRKEQIRKASIEFTMSSHPMAIGGSKFEDLIEIYNTNPSFIAGAELADKNPESQYNISDTDYVVSMIESALTSAEHLTTGNLAHNKAAIMLQLREALKSITTSKKYSL